MNPWFTYWLKNIYLPFSGAVEQDINTRTNFLSPQIELNFAGNQAIEKEVISHVASYGTQLSLLAKVVLELSKNSKSKEVAELTKLLNKIETVKKTHQENMRNTAKEALDKLAQQDPDALKRLLAQYTH
ncbi:DUF5405 family protein [Vibrio gazogenes]|uniref:DUF5405 domain-containing protein n=1 Tax=Vibrio gazogenes DSM 21264 = NBRC 103151 TaxID=1123492 RepID=A0A1M4TBI6_VIBGA|nr:DUF5405 family protein [Vibrio gazogenes]USP16057.1 DUF5405 family protein [Vibrio gazogenes]SHE41836.1 hypothetical protein SAMN02745781_00277 [Vibrio gazogenes DSM 21264] [Vibrio gazogenes DSM 21264 = NBRC 103151]SJN54283.1 hypothetical protein BQ6471_00926 [Vibrio gazogenes]